MDVFPFIAYCVTEFKTVFCSLALWGLLILPPTVPNKNTRADPGFLERGLICIKGCVCVGGGGFTLLILSKFY